MRFTKDEDNKLFIKDFNIVNVNEEINEKPSRVSKMIHTTNIKGFNSLDTKIGKPRWRKMKELML